MVIGKVIGLIIGLLIGFVIGFILASYWNDPGAQAAERTFGGLAANFRATWPMLK